MVQESERVMMHAIVVGNLFLTLIMSTAVFSVMQETRMGTLGLRMIVSAWMAMTVLSIVWMLVR